MNEQKQATPAEELHRQFMDHSTPLTEAGHWARRHIEQLEAKLETYEAIISGNNTMLEMAEHREAKLRAERDEAVSAVQRLSAGQPFDAVVVADTVKRRTAGLEAERDKLLTENKRLTRQSERRLIGLCKCGLKRDELLAENLRLREALEADRPKGIAEKFATLVKKNDGWYRGIIDYKIENGEVTRVGELKVTFVGEQSPNEFFKQEAKGPPFPDPAISANKATVILWEAKGPPLRDPAIEDKWNLTWPSLKTRENRGCRKRLAPGQWWAFCGETDMGQTAPALCTECGGEFKLEPVRQVERPVRPCCWRREWNGDVSDLGVYVHADNEDELDTDGPWQPLYDQAALDASVAAEREACAKLCESLPVRDDDVADECAAAIRARSNHLTKEEK